MAIDIKELVVRARVDPVGEERGASREEPAEDKKEMIAECVEQVLEILRHRKER